MKIIMTDIETLDTADSAAVIQIAALKVEFDESFIDKYRTFDAFELNNINVETFSVYLQHEGQEYRTISASTVAFHGRNNSLVNWCAALETGNAVPIEVAIEDFHHFLKGDVTDQQIDYEFWAKGDMDARILKNIYDHELDLAWPIPYWKVRDLRTLMKICNVKANLAVTHDGLDDCKSQLDSLIRCLQVVRNGSKTA